MKHTLLTLSLLLLTISSTRADTDGAARARKIAAMPSSKKQEPFKKLDAQESSPDTQQEVPEKTEESTEIDPFEQADQNFASIFKSLQDEMNNLNDMVRSAQEKTASSCAYCGQHKNTSSSTPVTPVFKSSAFKPIDEKYAVKETIKKDVNNQTLYELTINVPGYTTDDISVKFHNVKNKANAGKTLEIYAQKQATQDGAQKQAQRPSKKNNGYITQTSQQFASTVIINGKKRELTYKDGVLKIVLDLPNDVSGDYYTMSLQDDVLKISLPKSSDNEETKVLEFK